MATQALESFVSYWYIWTVGALLVAISVGFVLRFMVPARQIGVQLAQALAMLDAIRRRTGGERLDLGEIATRAMRGGRLPHLWQEYVDTLHAQSSGVDGGQSWRATTLAESFFTEQALVDTPLKTEFYKHLPGILTGLGIIGTFTGLIIGLIHFDVSLDPAQAQAQLAKLISAVGHAFFVSAAAITLAMLFTWIEKSLITARYRQVEDLRQAIDGLFAAGAGEEYLQRLVLASEASALHTGELRAALLGELRSLGGEFLVQQVQAAARQEAASERQAQHLTQHFERQSRDLAAAVGEVLGQRLGEPIADIAAAVKRVGAQQGDAVNHLITDVLSRFSQQLQLSFDGQAGQVNQLLAQTSTLLQGSAVQFTQLTESMDQAGRQAAEAMSGGLQRAFAGIEARAQGADQQLAAQLEQLRALMGETQAQAGRQAQQLAAHLGEQVDSVVTRLHEQAQQADERGAAQMQRLAQTSDTATAALSAQVERLLASASEASQGMQATAATLAQVTVDAIKGMNAGADTLYIAASEFSRAGQGVASTMAASTQGAAHLQSAAQTLLDASQVSQQMLAGYARSREDFAQMVADFKDTMATARRDASLTAELVDRLQAASGQLAAVQRKSEDYLRSVSEVLARAHQSFAENIERTLREANRQFHKELAQAVSLLSGAIRDLGDTIDDLPAKR